MDYILEHLIDGILFIVQVYTLIKLATVTGNLNETIAYVNMLLEAAECQDHFNSLIVTKIENELGENTDEVKHNNSRRDTIN